MVTKIWNGCEIDIVIDEKLFKRKYAFFSNKKTCVLLVIWHNIVSRVDRITIIIGWQHFDTHQETVDQRYCWICFGAGKLLHERTWRSIIDGTASTTDSCRRRCTATAVRPNALCNPIWVLIQNAIDRLTLNLCKFDYYWFSILECDIMNEMHSKSILLDNDSSDPRSYLK